MSKSLATVIKREAKIMNKRGIFMELGTLSKIQVKEKCVRIIKTTLKKKEKERAREDFLS